MLGGPNFWAPVFCAGSKVVEIGFVGKLLPYRIHVFEICYVGIWIYCGFFGVVSQPLFVFAFPDGSVHLQLARCCPLFVGFRGSVCNGQSKALQV